MAFSLSCAGGAISTMAERFASLLYSQAAVWAQGSDSLSSSPRPPRARSINVDYMSPCPKMAQLTLEAEAICIQSSPSSSSAAAATGSDFPLLYAIHQGPVPSLPTSFRVRFKDARGRCLAQAHVMYPPIPVNEMGTGGARAKL